MCVGGCGCGCVGVCERERGAVVVVVVVSFLVICKRGTVSGPYMKG